LGSAAARILAACALADADFRDVAGCHRAVAAQGDQLLRPPSSGMNKLLRELSVAQCLPRSATSACGAISLREDFEQLVPSIADGGDEIPRR
jgi:hypothetical protein